MDFLKRNSGKIALIAIIAFFTLPFIYSNEEEEDFSPFAVKSGMSYQANPISKLANKIASFYRFSKPAARDEVASAGGTDFIKEKVADNFFNKNNPSNPQANKRTNAVSKENNLVASTRTFKNYDLVGSNYSSANSQAYNGTSSFYGDSSSNTNSPIKGYVTVNGQKYAVIEDVKGEKYVVTPKGHIPYKELSKVTISEDEFLKAKKRLAGASDAEVLAALQKEKLANADARNYQGSVTNYKNGTAANIGGQNYARVSTSDKGFDADALSNAYADLKNINLKVDSSSTGGGRSGGNTYNNYYGGSSNNEDGEEEVFTPANIATQAREAAKQSAQQMVDETAEKRKSSTAQQILADNYSDSKSKVSFGASQIESNIAKSFGMPKIQNLQSGPEGYEVINDNTTGGVLFAETKDNNNIYSEWGQTVNIDVNGEQKTGMVLPEVMGTSLKELEDANTMERVNMKLYNKNIGAINNSIEEIKGIVDNLPPNIGKIYINPSDEPSKKLMENIMKISLPDEGEISLITDNPEEADISLPGFILTPNSFEQGAEVFRQQVENFQAENMPA